MGGSMHVHVRTWNCVLFFLIWITALGAWSGPVEAGWETTCERVPVTKLVPGTIHRPSFVARPELRCRRVWVPEDGAETRVEGAPRHFGDLERICLELDYPLDRCWEILAGRE